MIKRFFILLAVLCLFCTNSVAQSLIWPDIAHSTLSDTQQLPDKPELKPASLENSYQVAAICFLGAGDCGNMKFDSGDEEYDLDTAQQCLNEGFVKVSCNTSQEVENVCPHNSGYASGCKCRGDLVTCTAAQDGSGTACGGKYPSCICKPSLKTCASNQNGSGASCGGRYETCTCKAEYQYTTANCTNPRSVSGSACDGKYTACTCPAGVSAGSYGCKEYYPSPCGSVCKIAHSDNCHNRTEVQALYGCMSYYADCPSKCERAYTDNCRNRTETTAPYGCQTYWADCSTKCQTAKVDNCTNRTAVSTPYGCMSYFADCNSKCETAYPDNCHNRTAAASTYGCLKYYADCGNKCEIGATNCAAGDILYSSRLCSNTLVTGLTPIGVVFNQSKRQAVALEEKPLFWADRVELLGFAKDEQSGKANTISILNYGKENDKSYPALEYCYNYSTEGTNPGDWFLGTTNEMRQLYAARTAVNSTLSSKLGKSALQGAIYWTSLEYYQVGDRAWGLSMSNGITYAHPKISSNRPTRPMISF